MKGILIVFEGTDGTGKSTQIQKLATHFTNQGREVIALREPGGTALGESIRTALKHSPEFISPRAELLGMNCSRAQLVDTVITPSLQAGKIVLLDRFYQSTIAYQGFGRRLPLDMVHHVIKAAIGDLVPDHVFLLRLPVEEASRRRKIRQANLPFDDKDRFEKEQSEFFSRVEQGYDQIAQDNPEQVHVINAADAIEAVHQNILSFL